MNETYILTVKCRNFILNTKEEYTLNNYTEYIINYDGTEYHAYIDGTEVNNNGIVLANLVILSREQNNPIIIDTMDKFRKIKYISNTNGVVLVSIESTDDIGYPAVSYFNESYSSCALLVYDSATHDIDIIATDDIVDIKLKGKDVIYRKRIRSITKTGNVCIITLSFEVSNFKCIAFRLDINANDIVSIKKSIIRKD